MAYVEKRNAMQFWLTRTLALYTLLLFPFGTARCSLGTDTLRRHAASTLTAVELDHGDTLEFTLQSGQTRSLKLLDTWVRVVLTNVNVPKKGFAGGGTVYCFGCRVELDGQPLEMVRYVPVQASFYEPYVVDGVRVWFDAARKIGDLFNENHGECVPRKAARFAVQDATLPICAEEALRPWYPNGEDFIDVHSCYNADDVWLGTYFGADLHGGLDINMPIGTPLWAPISFDDHFFFNSLADGDNNNRWRAIRRWENGQRWVLQAHHITRLLVPEHERLRQGTHYGVAAGVLTGSHAHSHFVFKIGEANQEILLDPWILFWQIFENNKRRSGAIHAAIAPLEPVRTGEIATFHPTGSRPGVRGNTLTYRWTFGDGGCSVAASPTHVFSRPGIYPVTLVVGDGARLASVTQHITVHGTEVTSPVLALCAPDEYEFASRPVSAMDVYGTVPTFLPHTLRFTARPASTPRPAGKRIDVTNLGSGVLGKVRYRITYREVAGWAQVVHRGEGNSQTLTVSVDAGGLPPRHGVYQAVVHVECPGAENSPQCFVIQVTTPPHRPLSEVIVDNEDAGCYVNPYCWLAPRFHGPWPTGWCDSYLVAGGAPTLEGCARFQPDLAAGRYEVSFHDETPVRPTAMTSPRIRYRVRVRHKERTDILWVEPLKSRHIGTFEFAEGTDGYVQIESHGAEGLVVVDAVRFNRISDPP